MKKLQKVKFIVLWQVIVMLCGLGAALAAIELPAKLKDVPLYPESKIVQAMDMEGNTMALLEVKADRNAILDFYKKDLGSKGWKIVFQAEQENDAVIHFKKDEKMLQLSIQQGNEEKILQYNLFLMENAH